MAQAATGLSPQRPTLDPRPTLVGYVADEVALGHVFSQYFDFPNVIIVLSILLTHCFMYH
jgi:hypothetical protein